MCGIAGLVSLNSDQNIHQTSRNGLAIRTVALMVRAFLLQNVALGHRRLAIIDLTEDAQPMTSRSGDLVLSFNGEIYNYVELRSELKAKDVNSKASLIQVLLQAYDEWGESCVERFNGMWSFARQTQHRLFCSRDRFERNRFTSCGRVTGSI